MGWTGRRASPGRSQIFKLAQIVDSEVHFAALIGIFQTVKSTQSSVELVANPIVSASLNGAEETPVQRPCNGDRSEGVRRRGGLTVPRPRCGRSISHGTDMAGRRYRLAQGSVRPASRAGSNSRICLSVPNWRLCSPLKSRPVIIVCESVR
jgi:hypothetical protein